MTDIEKKKFKKKIENKTSGVTVLQKKKERRMHWAPPQKEEIGIADLSLLNLDIQNFPRTFCSHSDFQKNKTKQNRTKTKTNKTKQNKTKQNKTQKQKHVHQKPRLFQSKHLLSLEFCGVFQQSMILQETPSKWTNLGTWIGQLPPLGKLLI